MPPATPDASPLSRPAFLITVDTEGDDLWSRPKIVETRNAAYLPRFQTLCEEYGFKPTWLTNYEMAMDPSFVSFGRELVRREVAEIGMHLHAWNSPPIVPLTDDDTWYQPFLTEYAPELIEAKIRFITSLLRERFEGGIVSHRGGRWALDSTYAKLLVKNGYLVDCSVTPNVDWSVARGAPNGSGGARYWHFPSGPYLLDLDHIDRAGDSNLLELPVSIVPSSVSRLAPFAYRVPWLRRWAWRYRPEQLWLYPNGKNLTHMLEVVREAVARHGPCIEMALHSSDLMPGGSPLFPDEASIEALYRDLRALFKVIANSFGGMSLSEFRTAWLAAQQCAPEAVADRSRSCHVAPAA